MPIKLPKGFQRRKSSGNALEDVSNSEPSFKVIARPNSSGRSFEAGHTLRAVNGQSQSLRKNSFGEDSDHLFNVTHHNATNRGSGGTDNSSSTTPYDSGASSSRMSLASTVPSSVDTRTDKISPYSAHKSYNDIPVPPPHNQRAGFLRSAGRTFSGGLGRNGKDLHESPLPPIPTEASQKSSSTPRMRSSTPSSATTATPPRLYDSDLALDDSELDGFGNMFDGIGIKTSRNSSPERLHNDLSLSSTHQTRPELLPPSVRGIAPRSIVTKRVDEIESSPYSWTSRDGLMRSPSPSKTVTYNSPLASSVGGASMYNSQSRMVRTESPVEENVFQDATHNSRVEPQMSRQVAVSPNRPPPSAYPGTTISQIPEQSPPISPVESPTIDRVSMDTPQFDPALMASVELANKYQDIKVVSPKLPTKKIMTPAEFERYKVHKEETRKYNKVFGKTDSDDSGDDYEDDEEDEAERDKQAVSQRKKQEAHLAVYRQQMMKVTGETLPPSGRSLSSLGNYQNGNSSHLDVSGSASRLSGINFDNRQSHLSIGKSSADDEEEDEDVPLGILAAHGFPSKTRPPSKLDNTSTNQNLKEGTQIQAAPTSVVGESSGRGGLPPFARRLPSDPYFGAGLVNPAHRESLAMHSSANLPQPSGASTAHPHHPSGLIGVIAGEEKARALRRGSPNHQGGYDMPPQPGMGYPGMMPPGMMTPGDQAQIQMSQQMAQMMQMQMQWMQQMTQMMGNPSMPAAPMSLMGPPSAGPPNPMVRPQSVPLQNHGGPAQRSMSTLNPTMTNWIHSSPAVPSIHMEVPGNNYAHSIAPSERSNVGMASRYRPVSTIQLDSNPNWTKRSSTFTSSTFRPWGQNENTLKPPTQSTVRPVPASADDEDDEQGWADMKAMKDKKTKSWKIRKGQNALQELYNSPAL